MKKTVKKIIVYSLLVGSVQFGLGASILEASPRHEDQEYNQQRYEHREYREYRDHRFQEENERHERELRRYKVESYRDWYDRQEREKERHDNTMNELKAGLIGVLIGSMIN